MMRCDLRCRAYTAHLCVADELYRASRTDVCDVHMRTRIFREHDIARDGNIRRHNGTPLDTKHRASVPLVHRTVLDE